MSNNPNWKRQLQDKINEHNRQHGSKPKGVSNKTMHERACSLFRSFTLLRRLGYQIDLNNLAGRHIQMLVDYWTGNARIADRCRQRGVAMLERPHSTPYIEQQLSFLRVYGDTWIGKPGMVHPLADYVDDPARFKRSYAAKEDRSWEGNAVEFKRVVETVAAIDPRVAAQLALLLAFGLRRKEAVMFMPHSAVVPSESVPTSQHASDRYAVFLRIKRGTKGGRLRFVAIRNDDQRSALELALQFAPHPSSHLGHPGLSLKQSLKRFDNVMQKAGITKKSTRRDGARAASPVRPGVPCRADGRTGSDTRRRCLRRSRNAQSCAPRDRPPARPQSPADFTRLRRLPCSAVAVRAAVRDQEGGAGMRPIAHARRLSSRAASSRHAVDAVVVGNPVPIGIPALFLADQLSRGRTAEQILSGKRGLIAEYAGAEGYAYRWGHLIESSVGPLRPVARRSRRPLGAALGCTRRIATAHRRAADARAAGHPSRTGAASSLRCRCARLSRRQPPQPARALHAAAHRAARRYCRSPVARDALF